MLGNETSQPSDGGAVGWRLFCPLDEGGSAALLADFRGRLDAALADLHREISGNGKCSALVQQPPEAEGAPGATKKHVRLPNKVLDAMMVMARLAQVEAYARAVLGQPVTQISTSEDGTLLPKVWLSKELLASTGSALPCFAENELRKRLTDLGKKAAAPEQLVLMRKRLLSTLVPCAASALTKGLEPQVAAYESLKATSKQEAKRRAEELTSLAAQRPEALVGEKIEICRAGKWRTAKVLSFEASTGRHQVQDVQGAKADPPLDVSLAATGGEKWRRRDDPTPQPKFSWSAAMDRPFLEACQMQLAIGEREHEWFKHGLPIDLAGRSAACLASHSTWAADKTEHPEFVEMLTQLQKLFPNKSWMTVRAIAQGVRGVVSQSAWDTGTGGGFGV